MILPPHPIRSIEPPDTTHGTARKAQLRGGEPTLSRWSGRAALQAIPVQIAVLDADGMILWVNKAWEFFAVQNGCPPERSLVGVNYLAVCEAVVGEDLAFATEFASGIRSIISREREYFSMEYACHSPGEQRWFVGSVTPQETLHTVVAHVNITAQKLVEARIRDLNQVLETMVVARTSELEAAADALSEETSERRRLELEVLKISDHEQSRIGQDLHDSTFQDLTRIILLAEAAKVELNQEKSQTAGRLAEILLVARRTADEARRLVAGLFPAKLEHHGLEWALRELTAEISTRGKINCGLIMHSTVNFTPAAAFQLYRIAQEATNNALRHGRAQNITVEISESNSTGRMVIQDDGRGIQAEASKAGFGMHTMRYRAIALGGSLEVGPAATCGTTVVCSFPS
jgi:signal transduction histidine kinase